MFVCLLLRLARDLDETEMTRYGVNFNLPYHNEASVYEGKMWSVIDANSYFTTKLRIHKLAFRGRMVKGEGHLDHV